MAKFSNNLRFILVGTLGQARDVNKMYTGQQWALGEHLEHQSQFLQLLRKLGVVCMIELLPRDFQGASCQVQELLPLFPLILLFSIASCCHTTPHTEAQWLA